MKTAPPEELNPMQGTSKGGQPVFGGWEVTKKSRRAWESHSVCFPSPAFGALSTRIARVPSPWLIHTPLGVAVGIFLRGMAAPNMYGSPAPEQNSPTPSAQPRARGA